MSYSSVWLCMAIYQVKIFFLLTHDGISRKVKHKAIFVDLTLLIMYEETMDDESDCVDERSRDYRVYNYELMSKS